jgi:hypothetical protein
VKAITICQPWAWAIAAGHKIIENRPRQWHHRGPIAIHAGLSKKWMRAGCEFLQSKGIELPERFEFGAVIAVAQLVDCKHIHDLQALGIGARESPSLFEQVPKYPRIDPNSDVAGQFSGGWVTGPFCLLLRDTIPIAPVSCSGQLGLWECDVQPTRGPSPHDSVFT